MRVGDTAAFIKRDSCDAGAAFVTCGQDFWRVRHDADKEQCDLVIEPVYLTERDEVRVSHFCFGMFTNLYSHGFFKELSMHTLGSHPRHICKTSLSQTR